jgi:hypothetical protein
MKLEFEQGRSFESPTPNQISSGLASVGGANGSYAILSSNGDNFIQAAGEAGSGFVVEYREGDKLFQSASQSEPLSKVTEAFQKYARDDGSWRDDFRWIEQDFAPKSGCLGLVLLFVASAAMLAGVAA